MSDQDDRELQAARRYAEECAAAVQEIRAGMRRLQSALHDAEGRSQAAQARLVTTEAEMVRRYGREEVQA